MICHPLKWGWMDWPKVQPGATGLLRLWMLQVGRVRPVQIFFGFEISKTFAGHLGAHVSYLGR